MKEEYLIFRIRSTMEDTQNKLDHLGEDGWMLVCAYGCGNNYLIMKREIKKKS